MACKCDCPCSCDDSRFVGVMLRNGQTIYSPWFERQGDNLRAVIDVMVLTSTQEMVVGMYTKRRDEDGNGDLVDLATRMSVTSTGLLLQEWGSMTGIGLRDLVRYRFATSQGTGQSFILFRMLQPIWFDTIKSVPSGIPSGGTPT